MASQAVNRDPDTQKDQKPLHGRRVLPESRQLAQAWTENETASPGENKRLLPSVHRTPKKQRSHLQAGLTLGVHNQKKHTKCPQIEKLEKKTKLQRRKEKVIAALKLPYFLVSMIIVIVLVHLCGSKRLREMLEWYPGSWWREPWRLLTYGIVHANSAHLALNALVALAVGWRLEHEQGWWRTMCVWCGGVAAGALGAGALQPQVSVVGASAAVYALLTAHLPNVCLRFGHIPLWWFRPLSVVVLGLSELCWALMRPPALEPSAAAATQAQTGQEHVAWSAHLLGAAVGVPLAFIVFTGENDGKRHVLISRIISGFLLLSGIVLVALYYTFIYDIENI